MGFQSIYQFLYDRKNFIIDLGNVINQDLTVIN